MTRSDQAIDAAMSVTPIEQVSSARISSVISRLPFAKRARAVRPNDNPHPSLVALPAKAGIPLRARSEEHTSELQSLMRISYAVFCLKKQKKTHTTTITITHHIQSSET